MPAAAVAAVGSVAGAVISSQASSKASKQAANAQDAQLAFDMMRYDDWQNIFGGLQENLSNYYNSISPDYYVAAGLEVFEKEREAQMSKLNESLAQRGFAPKIFKKTGCFASRHDLGKSPLASRAA